MRSLAVMLAIVLAAAVAIERSVERSRRRALEALRAPMRAALAVGSLPALLGARAVALRRAAAEGADAAAWADLALVDGLLAHVYGADVDREAEGASSRATGAPGPLLETARALIELRRGAVRGARDRTVAAARADPAAAEPLLALADARAALGDLRAANQTLEAAMVLAPAALDLRVAWAQVRLDLGDAIAARAAARAAVAAAPDHTRARLLLVEADTMLGQPPPPAVTRALAAGCERDAAASPLLGGWCALLGAERARLDGDAAAAARAIETAARLLRGSGSARLTGRAAQVMGGLGRVDAAEALLPPGEDAPAIVWARAAIELGRGRAAPPPDLPTTGSETWAIAARAALASGGDAALDEWLQDHADARRHPDVAALARLRDPAPAEVPGPLGAYVAGLRARLAGDLPAAAAALARALDGHADACRAAGEYVATLRALQQAPATNAFDRLRAVNARCANLPGVAPPETSPPRRRHRHAR